MKRLNKQEVQLTPAECDAWERFHQLLDEGWGIPGAIVQVRQERKLAGHYSLSDGFWDWLLA